MFNVCCSASSFVNYDMHHNPKPLALSAGELEFIEKMLWYAPNISSYQSESVPLFKDAKYENILFEYIMDGLGMDEATDVEWRGKSDYVPTGYMTYFDGRMCINCQKIIICKYPSRTKTEELFRSIRNTIAHGRFTFSNGYFIGIDLKTSGTTDNFTGIIKLRLGNDKGVLKELWQADLKEILMKYAFGKLGYTVVSDDSMAHRFDFGLKKDGKEFVVELKSLSDGRFIHNLHIEDKIQFAKNLPDKRKYVLIIDNAKITKEVSHALENVPNMVLIDSVGIGRLFAGEDILQG